MKNVIFIFFVLLSTDNLYSQINVVAQPVSGSQYQFVFKTTGLKANDFLWDETEGFVNGFAKVTLNHLWTMVDANGAPVSAIKYEAVRNFYTHIGAAKLNNKWGCIDEKGNTVIPFEYDIIYDFKDAVTAGYKNNKWFLINRQALIIKTLDVDVFYGFKNGIANITNHGSAGKMNLNGDIISMDAPINSATPKIPYNNSIIARPQSAPCPPNIDFEYGIFTNWNCLIGSVAASGTTNVITVFPSPPTTTRHEIYSSPFGLDPYGLFSTAPPDGSGKALKLGNNINGAKAERVTYQITIPAGSTDASITYRYAVVFQDPGHFTYQQPRFSAKLLNVATNTYLPCASYEYVADSTLPGFFDSPVDDSVKCKNWASVFINLSAYAGQTLNLEFTTADCTRGAHWGYAYVDVGECNIAANISYQCSPSVATVSAPAGFQYYNWWNNNFTTILATGQNATISPIPPFNSTIHVEVIPFNGYGCKDTLDVLVTNSYSLANAGPDQFICNGSSTNIGTASIAGNVYSWSPSAFLSNANIATPSANPPTSTTYYLTVTNAANACPKIDTVEIFVNPKPIAAFTQPVNQCLAGNNFTFINTSSGATSYFWTFGDGTSSTLLNPTHTYTTASNYTVQLVTTTSFGCKDSVSHSFIVFPKPTAAFTQPLDQCLAGNSFAFINTSTGAASFLWTFGDGTTSTLFNPNHLYTTAANYTVQLVVTNSNGCKDSISNSFNVFPKPTAAFSQPINQCLAGNSFTFNNTSTGAASFLWTFGDGTNSTLANPTHIYTTAANFIVKLVVTNSNGCKDSVSQNLTVFPKPTAAFTQPINQCLAGNSFTFINTSTGAASFLWTFGDGTTSILQSPQHTYTTASNFTVKLVVTSSNGCKDSLSRSFTVFPKPIAAFSQPINQCLAGNTFTFNNTSSGAATYLWSFGDGTTSTLPSPQHTYTTASNFIVKLVVTSSNGCKDSISYSFNVFPKPIPAFTQPINQCLAGNSFAFNNTSTGATGYFWTFGDGTTSTLLNPTHIYATAANYTVQLVVTNTNGCKDSVSRSFTVFPKPTAAFTQPINQCLAGNSFTFNNTSNGAASFLWTFGDGSNSTLANPTHIYTTAANFIVKLVVTNSNGCKDSVSQNLNVFPKPTAAFTQPINQCLAGNSFTFINTSTGAASFLWTFGDGTSSTLFNPTHIYTTAANFIVKLVVTNSNGCKDSVSQNLTVFPKPTAAFTQPINQCLAGNSFTFINTSTGAATYLWSFGDGTNSTLQSPQHTYTTAANYIVQLVVTNTNGCKDSVSRSFTVFPKPTAAFVQPINQCLAGNSFTFNNTSTGAASFLWTFGDGSNSTLANPTHIYTTAANFIVKLVITNSNGCKDSVSYPITVLPKPNAAFTQPANQCLRNNVFVFANTSTGAATYFWNFGDNTTSTNYNPSHTYSIAGNFTVKLVVTNSSGCKDSITHTLTVNQSPNISIQNNYFICQGDSIQLSTLGAHSYQWYPTQGLSCTVCPNPMATPTSNITYTLTGLTNLGCVSNAVINITVRQPIKILVSPNKAVCGKSSTNLFAVGAASYVWSPATGLSNTTIANPVASPDSTTIYRVIGYDANNCSKDTGYVKITVNPIPAIELGPDVTLSTGTVYPIQPQTTGSIISWAWMPAINLSCTNCPAPLATVKFDITYRALVKNIYGCTAMDTIRIHTLCKGSQVFVPNAFTPDADGRNDKLVVRSSGVDAIRSFKIYSRWGELLFEKYNFPPNNPAYGWDGKIKGKSGSAEVYVYILEVTCDNNEHLAFKGNISILN